MNGNAMMALSTGETKCWGGWICGVTQRLGHIAPNEAKAGEWTHLAVVWTGSETRLYVNGKSSDAGASQTILHSGDIVEWRYEKNY